MTTSRYEKSDKAINVSLGYKQKFSSRWLPSGIQLLTNPGLIYPSEEDKKNITVISARWKLGDRLYKLAHEYYEDSSYWWVIAFYNKKPTEQSIAIGDLIEIPMSLTDILAIYGV